MEPQTLQPDFLGAFLQEGRSRGAAMKPGEQGSGADFLEPCRAGPAPGRPPARRSPHLRFPGPAALRGDPSQTELSASPHARRNKKKSPTLHTASSASLTTSSSASAAWGRRRRLSACTPQPGVRGMGTWRRDQRQGCSQGLQPEHSQNS
ncbi:uncharacterized protein [Muntiacus reevesi]|uniref:uncharacterized protein isoform X4 n=1 Tax=Muntiacus reevesi TaxID=9886 RepID=UPI00330700A8